MCRTLITGCLITIVTLFSNACHGQGDFFWSTSNLGESGINNFDANVFMCVGDTETLYLYWTTRGPSMSEIETAAAVDVATSEPGIIQFDGAEALDFDIVIDEVNVVGVRWGDVAGPAVNVSPDFIEGIIGLNLMSGNGIRNNNTGPIFFDQGYDVDADAFQFAKVEFTALTIGIVELEATVNPAGIINGAVGVDAVFGGFRVIVAPPVVLGDSNLDGDVNLLDIDTFLQILCCGSYQAESDCNWDGVVNLLDVPRFVELIMSGGE